jgi:hypothetical protein
LMFGVPAENLKQHNIINIFGSIAILIDHDWSSMSSNMGFKNTLFFPFFSHPSLPPWYHTDIQWYSYGGFLKWGYPQFPSIYRWIVHYKLSIWGTHLGKPTKKFAGYELVRWPPNSPGPRSM